MLSVVKLTLIATFIYIIWSMIGTALGRQRGLGLSFMMVEPPLLFAIIGVYLLKAKRAQ
jgi:lipopolysaccharide export LptBFGC system permease protein LptF